MRRAATAAMAATGLFLAACAGSGESEDTTAAGESTAETEPTTTAPATSDAPVTSEPVATDAAPADPATTLVASDSTDLPTTEPDSATENAPPTTEAGPLDVPTVGLIEVGAFDAPVDLAWRALDPRSFIVQQGGQIVAFDDESSTVVLDIADVDGVGLSTDGGEQGLLGLAFHPTDELAYIDFTDADGDTVIAEFSVDPTTGEFDPSTYREVLTIDQPYQNHNGGDLDFGPDGFLYIGTGDGGSGGDPDRNALDLTSRLGKLLRIDPTMSDDGQPFTVPADNPFLGADDADPTIWSYGLRNPWKFSFDPLTNDLWIGDVGQNEIEEIDLAPAVDGADAGRGLSFGWSAFEGDDRFNDDEPADGHVPPVVTYSHSEGGCSVSAGAVARNSSYADLNGWYLYGDFCSGQIWGLDTTSVGISDSTVVGSPVVVELTQVPSLVAIRTGPDGDLYALSVAGQMLRIVQG